jgi:phosphatidylserine/phosphatidylglycerophosphate/cardiolipin synthase-like enzyme
MGKLFKASAYCNGEVAYLAWQADGPIADCLGFMITRVHESGADAGQRRVLPTWIAFTTQSNPDWLDQDSSVWPIQAYEWRDLTLRQSRDTAKVRPIDFTCHYEITPVGLPGPGRTPVQPVAPFKDAAGTPRYHGAPVQLAVVGATIATAAIEVTHDYGASIKATYTNGILSTQNLLQQLTAARDAAGKQPPKPAGVKAGPTLGMTPGLLAELKRDIPKAGNPIRTFLTGDVLSFLKALMDRADKTPGAALHLALYELHDPELIAELLKLTQAGKAHVILSTAGSFDPNPKKKVIPPPPKLPKVWDTENHAARAALHEAFPNNVQDRLFNNDGHIGHNKFTVYSENGVAKAVLSGSTNWTETGLCTQSNNVILIEDDKVAALYLGYWNLLHADAQPVGVEAGAGKNAGFAPSSGVQGKDLRDKNAVLAAPVVLADGKTTVEVAFSPNTKQTSKSAATPPDLDRVYALMRGAQHAILFLTFLPGLDGKDDIIGVAADLAKAKPNLLVQGACSDPSALPPPAVAGEPTTYVEQPSGKTKNLPPQAIWWPQGQDGRVVMIRAAAVTQANGDLKPELLTAGHAIIHDKIIVLDPLDPVACTVITGSHNLGFKASYANDENLLIIRGNAALAISYAVHVLDVYDHYLMRAKLQDQLRKSLIATGKPPPASIGGGFLKTTPVWQDRWFPAAPPPPTSWAYFV